MRLPSLSSLTRRVQAPRRSHALDEVALHPGWRRALLAATPCAALAFLIGIFFELGQEGSVFDLLAYIFGIGTMVVLEVLFYLYPKRFGTFVSVLISAMSLFFVSKLVYLLFLAPASTDVLAEMTETYFWSPVVYVLAFFIPGVRWGRFSVNIFGVLTPLMTGLYLLLQWQGLGTLESRVVYALLQLNLASVVMIVLTRAFAVFHTHLTHVRTHSVVMEELAHTDTLTGLPNRLSLETILEGAIAHEHPFAVMFVDLDRFKRVNDLQGHSSGDELLRAVSERLGRFIRTEDVLARLSGDEFVLLARNVSSDEDAKNIAKKLQSAFATPFELENQNVRITASIGFCLYPQDGASADTLLRHADSAMYRAKAAGRDGLRRFVPADSGTQTLRALEKELQSAIEKGELALVYQPLYNLQSGQLVKVEALLRWHHPVRGLIPPDVFIPLAEESGLITTLGRWVLLNACRTRAAWQQAGYGPVVMAVNISPVQFAHTDFYSEVKEVLSSHALSGSSLELELTERTLLHDTGEVVAVLKKLQGLGVRIAVDDFGTGYSSLGYLKDLPLDTIKIDRSFVAELSKPRLGPHYAFALIQAITTIADTLDLEIVAEGVENEEQVTILRQLGCHTAQGYFFARPLPLGEVELLLPMSQGVFRSPPRKGALTN